MTTAVAAAARWLLPAACVAAVAVAGNFSRYTWWSFTVGARPRPGPRRSRATLPPAPTYPHIDLRPLPPLPPPPPPCPEVPPLTPRPPSSLASTPRWSQSGRTRRPLAGRWSARASGSLRAMPSSVRAAAAPVPAQARVRAPPPSPRPGARRRRSHGGRRRHGVHGPGIESAGAVQPRVRLVRLRRRHLRACPGPGPARPAPSRPHPAPGPGRRRPSTTFPHSSPCRGSKPAAAGGTRKQCSQRRRPSSSRSTASSRIPSRSAGEDAAARIPASRRPFHPILRRSPAHRRCTGSRSRSTSPWASAGPTPWRPPPSRGGPTRTDCRATGPGRTGPGRAAACRRAHSALGDPAYKVAAPSTDTRRQQ